MIQMLQKHILHLTDALYLLLQKLLVEKLTYLEADLRIFIGIEGSDTGLGRSEGFSSQSLLLVLIK